MQIAGGALPKHVEIAEGLIRRITAGLLPDGSRLPSEREMAASLGVAVGTLRKALARVAAEGLVERIQGSGNYVRRREAAHAVYALFRLELARGGGLPTAQVLSVGRRTKPKDAPQFGTLRDAHRIRRMRMLDGVPVALEEIWFDPGIPDELAAGDLSDSLYQTWAGRFGLQMTRVEDRVGISSLPGWAPEGSGLIPGSATGLAERLGWAAAPEAVEYSRTWFDPERARFVARAGGS